MIAASSGAKADILLHDGEKVISITLCTNFVIQIV